MVAVNFISSSSIIYGTVFIISMSCKWVNSFEIIL